MNQIFILNIIVHTYMYGDKAMCGFTLNLRYPNKGTYVSFVYIRS